MSSLIAIIGAILAFFIIVVVHEYGHFVVARWVGVKVLRFAIGFGKPIFKHRAKSGVEFVIGWLPLGGYVKMQDAFSQSDNLPGSSGDAFESKSLWARMAVVLAGPITNLILATFLFAIVYSIGITQMKPIIGEVMPHSIAAKAALKPGDQIIQMGRSKTNDWQRIVMFLITHIGDQRNLSMMVLPKNSQTPSPRTINLQHWQFNPLQPDLLSSIGLTTYFPKIPPVVSVIMPDSPAAKTDLRPNDFLLSINKQLVDSWQGLVAWVEKHPNQSTTLTVRRNGNLKNIPVMIGEKHEAGRVIGFLGIQPKPIKIPDDLKFKQQYPWYLSGEPALIETAQWMSFHLIVIKQMLMGRISLKALGGPISVFQTAGSASLAGLTAYLEFIAIISVVLGVLNLLPIPALDGGHFFFFIIEAVIRRPIPTRVQVMLINMGVIFLVTIMVYATLNDFTRLLQ